MLTGFNWPPWRCAHFTSEQVVDRWVYESKDLESGELLQEFCWKKNLFELAEVCKWRIKISLPIKRQVEVVWMSLLTVLMIINTDDKIKCIADSFCFRVIEPEDKMNKWLFSVHI